MKKKILSITVAVSLLFSINGLSVHAEKNEGSNVKRGTRTEVKINDTEYIENIVDNSPSLPDDLEEYELSGSADSIEEIETVSDSGYMTSGRSSVPKLTKEELAKMYEYIREYDYLYSTEPVIDSANYKISRLSDDAYDCALDWINYYRQVAGLTKISFTNELNESAAYGALTLAMNNTELTHEPGKPGVMSDTDYAKGYNGCAFSNISGYSIVPVRDYVDDIIEKAISGQIKDDAGTNAQCLGHRRWLLYPNIKTMGIGSAHSENGRSWTYTNVRVFGEGVEKNYNVEDYDFIAWPASGYNLTTTFGRFSPWSVTFNPSKYKVGGIDDIKVTLTNMTDNSVTYFDESDNNYTGSGKYFNINKEWYGIDNCIVFRPDVSYQSDYYGDYIVQIEGIKDRYGRDVDIKYKVNFDYPGRIIRSALENNYVSGNTAVGNPVTTGHPDKGLAEMNLPTEDFRLIGKRQRNYSICPKDNRPQILIFYDVNSADSVNMIKSIGSNKYLVADNADILCVEASRAREFAVQIFDDLYGHDKVYLACDSTGIAKKTVAVLAEKLGISDSNMALPFGLVISPDGKISFYSTGPLNADVLANECRNVAVIPEITIPKYENPHFQYITRQGTVSTETHGKPKMIAYYRGEEYGLDTLLSLYKGLMEVKHLAEEKDMDFLFVDIAADEYADIQETDTNFNYQNLKFGYSAGNYRTNNIADYYFASHPESDTSTITDTYYPYIVLVNANDKLVYYHSRNITYDELYDVIRMRLPDSDLENESGDNIEEDPESNPDINADSGSGSSGVNSGSSSSYNNSSSSSSYNKSSSSSYNKSSSSSYNKSSSSSSVRKGSSSSSSLSNNRIDYKPVMKKMVLNGASKATFVVGDTVSVNFAGISANQIRYVGKAGIYESETGEVNLTRKGSLKLFIMNGSKKQVLCSIKAIEPKIKKKLKLKEGASKQLNLSKVTSQMGEQVWISSDRNVADVSDGGFVTAKGRGQAVITAYVNGHPASCTVTVK